jgi:hypothetical protein
MEPKIKRKFRSFQVSLTTTEPTSVPIRLDDVAGGGLVMGTVATTALALDIWAAAGPGDTYGLLHKPDGSAVELTLSASTSQARTYSLPDECYAAGSIKLVAREAAATAANCVVMLKG